MIVATLLIAAALSAPQEEAVRAGNVVLRPPAGWKLERKPEGLFLSPGDLQEGETYVVIVSAGGKADGSLAEGLEKSWKEFEKDGKLVSKAPGRETRTEGGTEGLMSVGLLEQKDGSRLIISLAMFKPADRYEAVIALSAQDAVFQRYSGALGALLKQLRFRNVELPTYDLILTEGDQASVQVLFKDGGWLETCPEGGLDGFDEAASRKSTPAAWGTQETRDGVLRLRIGDRVRVLTPQADGSLAGKDPEAHFFRAPSSTGIRIEGRYGLPGVEGASLTFTVDGSFEDQGLIKALTRDGTGPAAGAYEISDNTLLLAGAGGGRKRLLFALLPASATAKSPDRIFVAGRWLRRR